MDKTLDMKDRVDKTLKILKEKTSKKILRIYTSNEKTGIYDSKFGGYPYLPNDFQYPMNEYPSSNKKPLKLLAQINFNMIAHIDGFPTEGILQFYIPFQEDDDIYGLDLDFPDKQRSFRIVYHSNIDLNEGNLQEPPLFTDIEGSYFPIDIDELKLDFEIDEEGISPNDFRFNHKFVEIYNSLGEEKIEDIFDLPEDILDKIFDEGIHDGHKLGGYPFFTQEDPRGNGFEEWDSLLLQIDTDDHIMWGDSGVCNFFIKKKDLDQLDFSSIIYNWDCM